MPGPSNTKKRKGQTKTLKKKSPGRGLPEASEAKAPSPTTPSSGNDQGPPPNLTPTPPPYVDLRLPPPLEHSGKKEEDPGSGNVIPPQPFIYDPGNGPRVRDPRAFLASKYFSQPPAFNVLLSCFPYLIDHFYTRSFLADTIMCRVRPRGSSSDVNDDFTRGDSVSASVRDLADHILVIPLLFRFSGITKVAKQAEYVQHAGGFID